MEVFCIVGGTCFRYLALFRHNVFSHFMPRPGRNLHTTISTLGRSMATLNFKSSLFASNGSIFGPRVGSVSFRREDGTVLPEIDTPGLITATSRGVVPHLSRDHIVGTEAVRWVQLPFESL